ncbi:Hsp20/alpha crystallin family protein [Bifidobacterium xylocopae]|uniref:Molecular chaperone Hsp20 n=1 Tax=Bifidobacterium xylocopae TaxID=2493119 RepID=A0A366KFG2_9BIFI|nr:Hsp20/alpha crystallin family protein [Bifidobacterium xylocopae]RBP99431.1 molecular chaperone Hsp20 [Bifidobacterium xylocopae]
MTMLPALMNNSIFGDFFDDPFFNNWRDSRRSDGSGRMAQAALMNTDVREKDGSYELDIDLPGFAKDDVSLRLEDGYLIVSAQKKSEQDDKGKGGKWIRRERYTGACSRSFYVGEGVKEDDIHAKFSDGTLHVSVPKESVQPVESRKTIAIEG